MSKGRITITLDYPIDLANYNGLTLQEAIAQDQQAIDDDPGLFSMMMEDGNYTLKVEAIND